MLLTIPLIILLTAFVGKIATVTTVTTVATTVTQSTTNVTIESTTPKPLVVPRYQALLYRKKKFPLCGGAIISPTVILTTAHCLRFNASTYKVAVGSLAFEQTAAERQSINRTVKHSLYEKQKEYDIGLILLQTALVFNNSISLVRVPDVDFEIKMGDFLTVTGWRLPKVEANKQQVLRFEMTVEPRYKCQNIVKLLLDEKLICAKDVARSTKINRQMYLGSPAVSQSGDLYGVVASREMGPRNIPVNLIIKIKKRVFQKFINKYM